MLSISCKIRSYWAYSSFRWKGIRMFNSLPMHIRNITACPPSVFKKQLDLHLSPMLDCPCTPNFNNSLDNKLYYVVSLRVTRLTKSQLNNQKKPEEEEERTSNSCSSNKGMQSNALPKHSSYVTTGMHSTGHLL